MEKPSNIKTNSDSIITSPQSCDSRQNFIKPSTTKNVANVALDTVKTTDDKSQESMDDEGIAREVRIKELFSSRSF